MPATKSPDKSEHIKASDLEKGIDLSREHWFDQRQKREIQRIELGKISSFFVYANVAVAAAVVVLALIEHFDPRPIHVVTEKVLIAAIAGVTVQAGAIVLAAFRGLFSGK